MVVIGTDSAERLDVVTAHFGVLVTHRPKLAVGRATGWSYRRPRCRADRGRKPCRRTYVAV